MNKLHVKVRVPTIAPFPAGIRPPPKKWVTLKYQALNFLWPAESAEYLNGQLQKRQIKRNK